ncbi:GH25 family lysozyme [uncultured Clostridium sp.]|uniref:GH25 family lysozyme n=1 Tax=uncultured Clostridium sp. TaxID=59620 RepID=UPI002627D5D3|nr:GH25 family lysozyme [uncultured Clostridium sp.]
MSDLNIKGIDISNYQGEIDFKSIELQDFEVCIIESGDGITFTNLYLDNQYEGAKNVGLKVGFYHFFRAEDDCILQAQAFYNRIKDKEFEVCPVLDVEVTMGVQNVTQSVLNFIEEFEKISGYECIIYTYVDFAKLYLGKELSKYNCWIADYGVEDIPRTIFNKYVGWQYTDLGEIEGLEDQFDFDKFSSEIFLDKNKHRKEKNVKIDIKNNIDEPLWKKCISGQIVKNLQYELDIQFDDNLVVDGWFGELTLNACVNIYFGAEGEITKIMQERLIAKGFSCGVFEADGIYGLDTERALKSFQKTNRLVADGVCGKETWRVLMLI